MTRYIVRRNAIHIHQFAVDAENAADAVNKVLQDKAVCESVDFEEWDMTHGLWIEDCSESLDEMLWEDLAALGLKKFVEDGNGRLSSFRSIEKEKA